MRISYYKYKRTYICYLAFREDGAWQKWFPESGWENRWVSEDTNKERRNTNQAYIDSECYPVSRLEILIICGGAPSEV